MALRLDPGNTDPMIGGVFSGIEQPQKWLPAHTGTQIRTGPTLLGWRAATLVERSGVSYPTVQRAETTDNVPRMKEPNLFTIQRTLEEGGVVFLDPGEQRDGGPGERLRVLDTSRVQGWERADGSAREPRRND